MHEAASVDSARRLLGQRSFDGAVMAVASVEREGRRCYDMTLVEQVHEGLTVSDYDMPITIMADQATPELVKEATKPRHQRLILQTFRARMPLEAIADFSRS